MQKARGHTTRVLPPLEGAWFQGLFHSSARGAFHFTPLLEVLFTFPSRYLSTIGLSVVFSLTGWAPLVPAEFLVLRGTQVPACLALGVSRTGLSPSTEPVSTGFRYTSRVGAPPVLQPRARPQGPPRFGLLRVRSPLLAQSLLFSLPPGT